MPIDSATAIAMPGRTPRSTTPRNAATLSQNSDCRIRYRRIVSGMSASESEAAITTAASVGCGRSRSRPGKKSRIRSDRGRADEPGDLGLRAGLLRHRGPRAAGADREALEQPGREVRRADADHLPLPVDLLAGASGERRRGRDRVGQRDERDAEGAADQDAQVGEPHVGHGEGREPLGQPPDERHAVVGQVDDRGDGDRQDHGERARPGTRGSHRCSHDDHGEAEQADGQRGTHRLAVGHPLDEARELGDEAVARPPRTRTAWAAGRRGS